MAYSAAGLASCRFENGQVLHLNLGAAQTRSQAGRATAATWGAGYEFRLIDMLQLTVETFGEDGARPDKAIGLRYEMAPGMKISGAVGRGKDRNFGQAGLAWEF